MKKYILHLYQEQDIQQINTFLFYAESVELTDFYQNLKVLDSNHFELDCISGLTTDEFKEIQFNSKGNKVKLPQVYINNNLYSCDHCSVYFNDEDSLHCQCTYAGDRETPPEYKSICFNCEA